MQKTMLIEDDLKLIEELNTNLSNITKTELKYIFKKLKEKDISPDIVDWYALGYDSDYDIIVGFIFQEYGIEIPYQEEEIKRYIVKNKRMIYNDSMSIWNDVVKCASVICVYGDKGSGKTALSFSILNKVFVNTKKKIFVYKYPKPKLIKKLGYNVMRSIEDLMRMENCCVYIDEPQLYFPFYEKRTNEAFARLMSLARQRDNMIVISTSVSHYINKMLECGIDVWVIKDTDYDRLKNGSRIKKVIQDNALVDPKEYMLNQDEYLFYSRRFSQYNSKHKFDLPHYFTDEMSKVYGNCD